MNDFVEVVIVVVVVVKCSEIEMRQDVVGV